MAARDVENARRGYAALNDAYRSGDVEDLRPLAEELWHPDLVLKLPGGILGGGEEWRGYDGMLRFISHQMEAFREMWVEPQGYSEYDETIVVPVRFGGQARHTGIEVEFSSVHVWMMSDGRAVRLEAYESEEEALRATGLE